MEAMSGAGVERSSAIVDNFFAIVIIVEVSLFGKIFLGEIIVRLSREVKQKVVVKDKS